jgi:O-antigen ligase
MGQMGSRLLVIAAALISAALLLFMVNMAFTVSEHPVLSLGMRIIFFACLMVLVSVRRRENFVYVFLLSIPFFRIAFSGIYLLTIVSAVLVLAYLKDIIHYLKSGKDIYAIPFVLIGISMVYSTVIARYPYSALERASILVSLFGAYLALTVFLKSAPGIRTFLAIMVILNIFGILVSSWQFIFGIDSIKVFFGEYNPNVGLSDYVKRIPSFFEEAQGAGLFFAYMALFCAGLGGTYFKKNLLVKAVIALSLVPLVMSGTRVAIIALIAGFLFAQLFTFSQKRVIALSMLIVFLFAFGDFFYKNVMPLQVKERFERRSIEENRTYRFNLWKGSLPVIVHNPLGVGMGGENVYAAGVQQRVYFAEAFNRVPEARKYTHFENTYLEILYSLGIVGFTGFLILIFNFFKAAIRIYSSGRDHLESAFSVYLMAAMVAWLLCVATSPRLYDQQIMLLFFVLVAVTNSFYQKNFAER